MTPHAEPMLPPSPGVARHGELWRQSEPTRARPLVRLPDGTIGYCMDPLRKDDCLRACIATLLQIPPDQVFDFRIDARLEDGQDVERINDEFWERFEAWLAVRGLQGEIHEEPPTWSDRWIGVIAPLTDDAISDWYEMNPDLERPDVLNPFTGHTVVMSRGWILHDPGISLIVPRGARLDTVEPSDVDYGITITTPTREENETWPHP